MPVEVLLGKPPRMTRDASRERVAAPLAGGHRSARGALRVLRLPAVADKTFLVTIGDRSVGGLTARDQMVGPWQVPVADVAVTTPVIAATPARRWRWASARRSPCSTGRRPGAWRSARRSRTSPRPRCPRSARAAVGELDGRLRRAGRGRALFDTVRAVGEELCPALGIAIPVGKDSLSMRTRWRRAAGERAVIAPVSLIVSAFAPVADVRRTLTPQLRLDCGRPCCC
jgi:phosphoribosylformylglycinamidine synthase